LAEGIDNAAIFCCFLTPEYEQSLECHTELKYAKQKSAKIISCILTESNLWKYSEWLTSIIGNLEPVPFDVFQDISDISDAIDWLLYYMKNDASSYINLPSSIASKSNYLFEIIKYEYQRNNRIERLINPAQSFSIEQSYINLVIVNTKDQLEKEKQMDKIQHSDAIMGTYEDIYGVKTTIEIKEILKSCKGDKKQILVFGRAGIGKSTFCRYITYQWAKGSYWSEYELVALIPLRRLTTNRYPAGKEYTLVDLVIKEVFSFELSDKEEQIFKEQFDANKTLWILDGYDEIIGNIPSHLERLFENLFRTLNHIITSRPYLNTLSRNVKIEITGFTDKNITEYIHQFFELIEEKSENDIIKKNALLKFLKSKQSIWGIAHIPVNLELICSVWSNQDLSEIRHLTITTLYTTMTEWLCRRYLMSQNHAIQMLFESEEEIYEQCQKQLTFLENLAFHAMDTDTIIIQPPLLKSVLKQTNIKSHDYTQTLKIGLLKSFDKGSTGNQLELEKDHYFIHLSFQEYYAARYLIHALNDSKSEEAKAFINRQKYNQRYALVFQFISGLISETHSQPKAEMFWNIILREPLDMVGIRHMQLVISCLGAASDITTIPNHSELLERIADHIQHCILQPSKINSNQIIQYFKTAESVINNDILLEMFISLLEHSDANINQQTLIALRDLNVLNQLDRISSQIANFLTHQENRVRESACRVLGKMGEKAATNEVIDKIISAIGDPESRVRSSACWALGNMGEKTATNKVIDKLISALGDDDYRVKIGACWALGKMGEKATTNRVIDKLISALGDQDNSVRESACEALDKMGEKAATNKVVDKLISALGDQEIRVRYSACETLGKMGEKAATHEVIDKLISALGDQEIRVRYSACEALDKMGEKAATNEVIDKLVSALGDRDNSVRESACEALDKMGEKAATNKVVDKLISALGDQEIRVRYSACKALGNMGEKAATNEVIDKIISAIGDPESRVRSSACWALGKMGEKTATNKVIDKLISALGDDDYRVKIGACWALGKMGEKATTNKVVDKLISALGDQDNSVRESACIALGKMGEKAATHEVIDKLISALGDQEIRVRYSACETLGKMGKKATTNEVIDKLVSALGDQEIRVRESACEALDKMGEKAATNKVVDKLISALGDQEIRVRYSACEALGKMGEKAATNKVVDKLISALGDRDNSVRESACKALGNMGEKAATHEVIDKLISALGDRDNSVRESACKALGNMGEKAATNELIERLVSALRDRDNSVRESACEALGNMGEKAVTDYVIRTLLTMMKDGKYVYDLRYLLVNLLKETSVLERLNSRPIIDFYELETNFDILEGISLEKLMKSVRFSSDHNWRLILSRCALLRGAALIEYDNGFLLYDKSEPIPLVNIDSKTREGLKEIFRTQCEGLHLLF